MQFERFFLILAHLSTVTLLGLSHPRQSDCHQSYGERIKNDSLHSCTRRPTGIVVANLSKWKLHNNAFKLNLTDSKQGVLSVKFPIPDIFNTFDIFLHLNKSAKNEEECLQSSPAFLSTHSSKRIYRDRCTRIGNGTCSSCSTVYLETEFQNVFTACYRLKVIPSEPKNAEAKNFSTNRCSDMVFIKSDYKNNYIQTPKIAYDYSDIMEKLYIVLPLNQTWTHNAQLALYFPYKGGVEKLNEKYFVVVDLHPNITVQQCEINNSNHKWPACQSKDLGIECTFYNIIPGNYSIRARILNEDRCAPHTVWTDGSYQCVWVYNLVAENYSSKTSAEEIIASDGSISYIYVLLGTVAFLVLLAGIFHGIRTSHDQFIADQAGRNQLDYSSKLHPKEKVLLLYAQDCSYFMDLMDTFRNILQKNSTCEVYDMFDPLQWGTIAKGCQEWVQKLLSQDDVMVVIVDTTSAVLHQNALENNFLINYFQPQPHSHLFTYALQYLTNNIQRNVYKKSFVVRLNGFSDDGQTLRYIAPLRRYLLPDHLPQLLSSLKVTSCFEVEDCSPEDIIGSEDLQRLLDKLISYKVENPDYLKTVLYRTTRTI